MSHFDKKILGKQAVKARRNQRVKRRKTATVSPAGFPDAVSSPISARGFRHGETEQQRKRFSNLQDMVVVPNDRQDAWVVFEEMLYEQDCRFSNRE